MILRTFQDLRLSPSVVSAIDELNFSEPTPIQQKAIPLLKAGCDVIGQAQTGTGKTAAFGIPLAERISENNDTQALILTPTRELALQVANELKKITKYRNVHIEAIFGGQPIVPQMKALNRGVQVVVGTPGRILDHIKRKTLVTAKVEMVVIDEADEMLDMGFIQDIELILKQMPAKRQTMLFSATLQNDIKRLAKRYMDDPTTVSVTRGNETASTVDQVFYRTFEAHKLEALTRIIESKHIEVAIVFCRTKKGVSTLAKSLNEKGYKAEELHGDLTQPQRLQVMKAFREKRVRLLIATDIAARGIDVAHVTHVVNYDIPEDPEQYVHRIGRTGRAGKSGVALTLVTPQDAKFLHAIEMKLDTKLHEEKLPGGETLIKRKYEKVKREINFTQPDNYQDLYSRFARDLLSEYSPEQAVSSLLKAMLSVEDLSVPEEYRFGDTGGAAGMIRFFLNVGRNMDLYPKKLVDDIAALASIPKKEIGRIDIFDRFSFFEVSQQFAPFVYECLKQEGLNGSRIYLEPAKPPQKRLQQAR